MATTTPVAQAPEVPVASIGCYTLDLYCDGPDHLALYEAAVRDWSGAASYRPQQFTGQTEAECLQEASREGWRRVKVAPPPGHIGGGVHFCPRCVRAEAKAQREAARGHTAWTAGAGSWAAGPGGGSSATPPGLR